MQRPVKRCFPFRFSAALFKIVNACVEACCSFLWPHWAHWLRHRSFTLSGSNYGEALRWCWKPQMNCYICEAELPHLWGRLVTMSEWATKRIFSINFHVFSISTNAFLKILTSHPVIHYALSVLSSIFLLFYLMFIMIYSYVTVSVITSVSSMESTIPQK